MSKPKIFTAVVLFIGAYSPLGLIFAIKDFDFSSWSFNHFWISIIILFLSILSGYFSFWVIKNMEAGNFSPRVTGVFNRSTELTQYVIPYILAFVGDVDYGKTSDVVAILLFLVLLFLISYKTKLVFINPILAIFGYSLYEINCEWGRDGGIRTGTFIVISRSELQTGKAYNLKGLTRYLYLNTNR